MTSWDDVKENLSDMNHIRLAEVYEINNMMVDSWKNGMNGRPFPKFNALCGTEIERMHKLALRYDFHSRELSRHSILAKKS